jgi:alanyl-tRNA synthetase
MCIRDRVRSVAEALSVSRKNLLGQIARLQEQMKEKDHELKTLRRTKLQAAAASEDEAIRTVKGVSVLVRRRDGVAADEARAAMDELKKRLKSGIGVLGAVSDGKALLVVGVTKDLTGRIQAGTLIKKLAPLIGGGGGGRPDFAQAGGSAAEDLDKALEEAVRLIEAAL